mmetsp:Transcript_65653/g.150471  ORF Transcript_65653/g.150471 Transcript_65653/m.150471 type:complete len:435 (+) Transcript_65653:776-2080(+)
MVLLLVVLVRFQHIRECPLEVSKPLLHQSQTQKDASQVRLFTLGVLGLGELQRILEILLRLGIITHGRVGVTNVLAQSCILPHELLHLVKELHCFRELRLLPQRETQCLNGFDLELVPALPADRDHLFQGSHDLVQAVELNPHVKKVEECDQRLLVVQPQRALLLRKLFLQALLVLQLQLDKLGSLSGGLSLCQRFLRPSGNRRMVGCLVGPLVSRLCLLYYVSSLRSCSHSHGDLHGGADLPFRCTRLASRHGSSGLELRLQVQRCHATEAAGNIDQLAGSPDGCWHPAQHGAQGVLWDGRGAWRHILNDRLLLFVVIVIFVNLFNLGHRLLSGSVVRLVQVQHQWAVLHSSQIPLAKRNHGPALFDQVSAVHTGLDAKQFNGLFEQRLPLIVASPPSVELCRSLEVDRGIAIPWQFFSHTAQGVVDNREEIL